MTPRRRISLLLSLLLCCGVANALSLSLDSIAAWGKFPRFCINTYRWGDQFFNGFDTAYVKGSGYKFNVKARSESWIDFYDFRLPNDIKMRMSSDPSTTAGFWLSYMAVSVGYDKNISRFFGNPNKARQMYSFGFNCSLFAFNMVYSDNAVGTKITRFGAGDAVFNPNINFQGADIKIFECDLYYFFNHKKYSQGAAFSYGRVQTRSQGSWFAGLLYSRNNYDFNFSMLPQSMKDYFPPSWSGSHYSAETRNFCFKVGYGYNWVFAPHWVLGILEAPIVGARRGFVNSELEKTSFAFSNQIKVSVVWNNRHWFAGAVFNMDNNLIYDKESTFSTGNPSFTFSLGYRFNLW